MMTNNNQDAAELARELDKNNKDRQKMTETLVRDAAKQIEPNQHDSPILFVLGENWPTCFVVVMGG